MTKHETEWRTPRPLWRDRVAGNGTNGSDGIMRPVLLRFASDSFMEDFLRIVDKAPSELASLVATPETWRCPTVLPTKTTALLEPERPVSTFTRRLLRSRRREEPHETPTAGAPLQTADSDECPQTKLRLYQPAHERYYLVAGSLVCRIAGFPDRKLDPGQDEQATFVVRRLLPPTLDLSADLPPVDITTWEEYAYVMTPSGSGWSRIGPTSMPSSARFTPGEQQHRLFTVNYTDDGERDRRMFAGLVPVGSREAYMSASRYGDSVDTSALGAGASSIPIAAPEATDPRIALFRSQVLEPWRSLIEQAEVAADLENVQLPTGDPWGAPGVDIRAETWKLAREQIQTGSWYVLLDFAEFLRTHLEDVWDSLGGPATGQADPLLVSALNVTVPIPTDFRFGTSYASSDIKATLAAALEAVDISTVRDDLEGVTDLYDRKTPASDWPSFLFPLADPRHLPAEVTAIRQSLTTLETLIEAAVVAEPATTTPGNAIPTMPPLDLRDGWFVIRCLHERRNCGMLHPPQVSASTEPFQLASFFDPDAPARQIRISLPFDTTPAGLRKFAKNTAILMPDILACQLEGLKKLSFADLVLAVLPWPFHKDLSMPSVDVCRQSRNSDGMMCSLSIPIVTICALILLIMIVYLLDQIFRWVPFFISCFRLPGMRGK